MQKQILLASPRGFCAGVIRAIDIVNLGLDVYGKPLYVLNEIVHNRHVVDELRAKGVVFVRDLAEVPPGSRVIFSAHGISPEVRLQAKERNLQTIDATCPLVTKVHLEALKYKKENYTIVLIGHRDHEEVTGTLGEAPDHMVLVSNVEEADRLVVQDAEKIAYLTQTTLSLDDTREIIDRLRERFPKIKGPAVNDICYATQNRQGAIQQVSAQVDLVLVVGSANSSNSNRLVEVASKNGSRAYLIEDGDSIRPEWLVRVSRIGISAGASTPEELVNRAINKLRQLGYSDVIQVDSVPEDVHFALPPELATVIRN
ncbi:MAG TPA: 4-hydroxy-3-methylbut-2-enyl diphosphate reductase [Acidobacteriota bacterium]|nr:4-hydroxy-3-methylbut-2-enyl diphosphate reductase [Acidobacteriota bacterium]